mgnify:CR=1 FL=1
MLDDIKKRGKLIVGVKADYKPFGFRDPSGAIVGLEVDLAAAVAKKIGVTLEVVPVVSANRMEFLTQGKIDLMIATMSDTAERRKVVGIVDPVYYASGVAIMANKVANKVATDVKSAGQEVKEAAKETVVDVKSAGTEAKEAVKEKAVEVKSAVNDAATDVKNAGQ